MSVMCTVKKVKDESVLLIYECFFLVFLVLSNFVSFSVVLHTLLKNEIE